MKKAAKVEYGITITKPWSREMYDHNDKVAEIVRDRVNALWMSAVNRCQDESSEEFMSDVDWMHATPEMIKIQKAVTCYGFGSGYSIAEVVQQVVCDIKDAAYYRLKEIAEDLELLDMQVIGFVGFS
jgi:hypothetical protein